jgi:hypothetical protein
MYTIIKMIVIAVAIGMWIGPRSVVIAFVLGEAGLGFDVLTDHNSMQPYDSNKRAKDQRQQSEASRQTALDAKDMPRHLDDRL